MSISASIFQMQDGVIDADLNAEAACDGSYWCDEAAWGRPCYWGDDVGDRSRPAN